MHGVHGVMSLAEDGVRFHNAPTSMTSSTGDRTRNPELGSQHVTNRATEACRDFAECVPARGISLQH